jgi:hypothetical protein
MSESTEARRPHRGSQALLAKFPDPDSRTRYFRELAERSHRGRVVMTSDEIDALSAAYAVLDRVVARHRAKLGTPSGPTDQHAS